MIDTVEQLKQERPDLVELFEAMDREQLLEQIYKEIKDALNMEERVSVFMEIATNGMSYTTYTPESIKTMVQNNHDRNIAEWCLMTVEDGDDEYILNEVKAQARQV